MLKFNGEIVANIYSTRDWNENQVSTDTFSLLRQPELDQRVPCQIVLLQTWQSIIKWNVLSDMGTQELKSTQKLWGGSRDERGNRGLNANQSAPNTRGKKSAVAFPQDQSCLWAEVQNYHSLYSWSSSSLHCSEPALLLPLQSWPWRQWVQTLKILKKLLPAYSMNLVCDRVSQLM